MNITETVKVGGSTSIGSGGGSGVGFAQVKPIFEKKCGECHGKTHPLNWTVYDTAKQYLSSINNRIFVVGNMPAAGSLTADEKATIKAWIAAKGPLEAPAGGGGGTGGGGTGGGGDTGGGGEEPDTPVESDDPVVRGEWQVKRKCLSCHGEGASAMKTPVLHGQFPKFIAAELNKFKNDQRKDTMMNSMPAIAKGLSDQDITDIAAYLETLNACSIPVQVDPGQGDIERGKKVFEENACVGCHRAKNTYGAPKLEGQKTEYVLHSLRLFKTKERTSTWMNPLTANFSDETLQDLAAYVNSLRKCD